MNEQVETARLFRSFPADFGPYQVQRLIGKGGMGAVYLAEDTRLPRPVALKMPCLAGDDRTAPTDRFAREIRAAAALYHPNLCPILEVGTIDGIPYFSMPYIEGLPLAKSLQGGQRLPVGEAVRIAREIALAMHEAHRRGIVHRDLKPANILLTCQDQPVVLDFGLARCLLGAESARLTLSGAVLGTPSYLSPEQAAAQEAGPASDIYSLGVILYEMLVGRTPFQAAGVGPLLAQIERDAPPAPRQWRPELPLPLEAICLKALAKRPAERFGTMAEFAAALAPYLAWPAAEEPFPATLSYSSIKALPPSQGDLSPSRNPGWGDTLQKTRLFRLLAFVFGAGSIVPFYIGSTPSVAVYREAAIFTGAGVVSLFMGGIFLALAISFRKSP